MKTDDLVAMLASGAVAVDPDAATRRYAASLAAGALCAVILMLLFLGIRSDLAAAARLPMFWFKSGFVALLAVASGVAVLRLGRPGSHLSWVPLAWATPVVAVWALAAFALATASPGERSELLYGTTAAKCPLLIALLSAPAFIAVMWVMRTLAPTRLRLAGAAAGLLAGSIGALAYSVHCIEMAAPFLATWYLLGVLVPVVVGAVLGPRLLRW
jgi:hypothetical protein